jgi:hypothetical protein
LPCLPGAPERNRCRAGASRASPTSTAWKLSVIPQRSRTGLAGPSAAWYGLSAAPRWRWSCC